LVHRCAGVSNETEEDPMNQSVRVLSLIACAALAACGAEGNAAPAARQAAVEVAAPAAQPAGNVIEVRMVTDDKGNYFDPAQITVKQGDVVRFTLVSGVHNLSFPSDKNAGASGLPGPSEYLQMAGQTIDVPVSMTAGEYSFQCDPHAALGMVGTLTVQ
jgi:plastocyanin